MSDESLYIVERFVELLNSDEISTDELSYHLEGLNKISLDILSQALLTAEYENTFKNTQEVA